MQWTDFLKRQRRALVIGRGPSAARAPLYLPHVGYVVTVNEICLDVPGEIDLAAFVDSENIELAKPAFGRIRRFLCPHTVHIREWRYDETLTPAKVGIPGDRLVEYPWKYTHPNRDAILEEFVSGQPCLCLTITTALHAVAMLGFRDIWCIGTEDLDGTVKGAYVPIRASTELFALVIDERFGTRTRFWNPVDGFGDM